MAKTPSIKNDARELADDLRAALHRLVRQLRRGNDDANISPLQKLLLVAIMDHPGIGVGELAAMERVRSPTISGHIKGMAEAGLVKRTNAAAGDRRRVGLTLTAHGQATMEAMRKQRTDRLAQGLSQLSPASRDAIRAAIAALNELEA
jgi:DNA-binding MarR family transcriptional regulator